MLAMRLPFSGKHFRRACLSKHVVSQLFFTNRANVTQIIIHILSWRHVLIIRHALFILCYRQLRTFQRVVSQFHLCFGHHQWPWLLHSTFISISRPPGAGLQDPVSIYQRPCWTNHVGTDAPADPDLEADDLNEHLNPHQVKGSMIHQSFRILRKNGLD